MSLRSPLGKVRGLGSAKEGVIHWWAQRMTAVALIPLLIWFVASIAAMAGADYGAFREWIATPVVSVLLVLMTIAVFHHAQLGRFAARRLVSDGNSAILLARPVQWNLTGNLLETHKQC